MPFIPGHILHTEDVLTRVSSLYTSLSAAIGAIVGEHDISASQFGVLRVLESFWPEPVTCSDIGCQLLDRTPDVTRMLDRLEKRGLITRQRCEEDRRVVYVHLSKKGRILTEILRTQVSELKRRILSGLDCDEVEQLEGLLGRISL